MLYAVTPQDMFVSCMETETDIDVSRLVGLGELVFIRSFLKASVFVMKHNARVDIPRLNLPEDHSFEGFLLKAAQEYTYHQSTTRGKSRSCVNGRCCGRVCARFWLLVLSLPLQCLLYPFQVFLHLEALRAFFLNQGQLKVTSSSSTIVLLVFILLSGFAYALYEMFGGS